MAHVVQLPNEGFHLFLCWVVSVQDGGDGGCPPVGFIAVQCDGEVSGVNITAQERFCFTGVTFGYDLVGLEDWFLFDEFVW